MARPVSAASTVATPQQSLPILACATNLPRCGGRRREIRNAHVPVPSFETLSTLLGGVPQDEVVAVAPAATTTGFRTLPGRQAAANPQSAKGAYDFRRYALV